MAAIARGAAIRTEHYRVRGMSCESCVGRVKKALGAVPGVAAVRVGFRSGTAEVDRDPAAAPLAHLVDAVAAAGYTLVLAVGDVPEASARRLPIRPIIFGALAASGLFALYLGLVTLAQGWEHAFDLLAEDIWFVLPLMLGFGTQVGLYVQLRALHAATGHGSMATSTGTSTAAMLACCVHHVTDILPIIGLSGAAVFLVAYKTQLLWLGLIMNLTGIGYLIWQLQRWHRRAAS